MSFAELVETVSREFSRTPAGPPIGREHVATLWGVDQDIADTLLDALVAGGELYRTPDGRFGRFGPRHPVRAPLKSRVPLKRAAPQQACAAARN